MPASKDIFLTAAGSTLGHRVASIEYAHIGGDAEMQDSKVLLVDAHPADDRQARRLGKAALYVQAPPSGVVILLLSLGLWIVIWEAATSLASAVLR